MRGSTGGVIVAGIGLTPTLKAMAAQLTDSVRVAARSVPDGRSPGEFHPEIGHLLERTSRLSAALLRASTARAYLQGPGGTELVARFPTSGDPQLHDERAHDLAGQVVHSGRSATSGSSRSRANHEAPRAGLEAGGSHLGVPLALASGHVVGALVVSDLQGRMWPSADLESLTEFAAMAMAPVRAQELERMLPLRSLRIPIRTGRRTPSAPQSGGAAQRPGRVPSMSALPAELFAEAGDAALVEILRESIVGNMHLGAIRIGDRLPSIRQTARAFAVTPYMVLQAYAELEVEGLVERRERSGVFVADLEAAGAANLPETGEWLTEVLTQACRHQVKIPLLPDLIRRWTTAVPIRCTCVESCLDSRFALAHELSHQFGIESVAISSGITIRDLRDADLVITTAYHAAEIAPLAAELRRPLLIATVSPLILSSALNYLRERNLTVICVDPIYGERLRALQGGAYRDRVRVVTTDDAATLAQLDRSEAVLLTPAARHQLLQPDFRLVAPLYPSYSLDFARKVAEAIVRINLQGSRG